VDRSAFQAPLVSQRRIVLLDEPFAALDAITRFRLSDDLLH
jgi:ABC-type nitrate/sulfonate/bicarbonate transport system ATPase subunit